MAYKLCGLSFVHLQSSSFHSVHFIWIARSETQAYLITRNAMITLIALHNISCDKEKTKFFPAAVVSDHLPVVLKFCYATTQPLRCESNFFSSFRLHDHMIRCRLYSEEKHVFF